MLIDFTVNYSLSCKHTAEMLRFERCDEVIIKLC